MGPQLRLEPGLGPELELGVKARVTAKARPGKFIEPSPGSRGAHSHAWGPQNFMTKLAS